MAILRRAPAGQAAPGLARLGTWLALVALLGLAGCMLVEALVQEEPAFAFSHRLHVEDEGLECALCHARWDADEEPGMPKPAQCALCHSDIDAEKPPARQVASLFDGDVFRAARAGHQSDEILFSHRAHAERAADCSECHAEVASDEGTLAARGAALRTSMDGCLACHAGNAGPDETDCTSCHAQLSSEHPPQSHHANWKRYHGGFVRGPSPGRMNDCALCHQPSECTTCHQIELPENHNNYWRRRGHGLTAAMDRDSCATCHDSDSCNRCHEDTRPLSHVGSWGAPRDRHCLACHEPLRGESCVVCHKSTPSHDLATPMPPDHLAGMNCRMCHGNGQPLPHVDNGQVCTDCHR